MTSGNLVAIFMDTLYQFYWLSTNRNANESAIFKIGLYSENTLLFRKYKLPKVYIQKIQFGAKHGAQIQGQSFVRYNV